MASLTTAGRWGARAAALTRVALGGAQGSRIGGALFAGARAALRSVLEALRRLWLEVTGLFFLLFAAIGALAAWREYQAWSAGRIGPGRLGLALAFAVVFAWFAVTSFGRAWRKRPSSR